MADRAIYLGPRIRRLRRNLGLKQSGMAADLGISASYIALIESNQRPLTADMLLRIARTYKVDVTELAGDDGNDLGTRLQAALKDPMFADLEMPPLQDVDVANNYPAIAEAFLRLHTAYREEQIVLADRVAEQPGTAADPVAEARRFLAARRNFFPILDDIGELLSKQIDEAGGLAELIAARHGLRVRPMPPEMMGGAIRRYDPHHRAIFIDDRLDGASRRFQLAQQLIYLQSHDVLAELVDQGGFATEDGKRLGRRALAAYGAAAALMPYAAFREATEKRRYDIEALGRQFATSFEQVAHRLTTLQRPGEAGVPFFFIRIDAAGNVSKRLDGAGFPFARHGGGCPLWTIHDAVHAPQEIITQWLELPDGQRFFSIARAVTAGGGAYGAARVRRAITLCCAAEDAKRLIYTSDNPMPPPGGATPIGINCGLCHREACAARATPPIGRSLLSDDYHRRQAPFGFGDE